MQSLFSFLFFIVSCSCLAAKKVVITIDDEPFAGSSLFPSSVDRAQKIIDILTRLNVPPVGIFVVGQHIKNIGDESVKLYGNSKRAVISNHTYSHRGLKSSGADAYIRDIKKLDEVIKDMPGFHPFFRYPYLDMGTKQSYATVEGALHSMGYSTIPVTITNDDYRLNFWLQGQLSKKRKVDYNKLRDIYLKHMMGSVHRAEAVYDNDSGAHVLLMHANDTTALYLGDLIGQMRKEGWEIVSVVDEKQYVKPRNSFGGGVKDGHTQTVGWLQSSLQGAID